MAAGFQVWDANGNLIFDATYRVMRIVGNFVPVAGSGASGIISADARLAQGCWVSFQPSTASGEGYLNRGVVSPRFSFSGGTLSYSYAAGNNGAFDTYQGGIVFYGAY